MFVQISVQNFMYINSMMYMHITEQAYYNVHAFIYEKPKISQKIIHIK